MSSLKGGVWERKLARTLSLWWTEGKDDSVIWRTSASGARATVRTKVGKRTAGAYGDLHATDPVAQPLFAVFTIEAKKGYPSFRIGDLLESKAKGQLLPQFLKQAQDQAKEAGTRYWLLIVCKDRKEPVVFYPVQVHDILEVPQNIPYLLYAGPAPQQDFAAMSMEDFLTICSPDQVRGMLNLGKRT